MSTKKLAKELGLLRKRRNSTSQLKENLVSNQIFSYLIVIDFESTCWREKSNYSQEIIEFPAVLLNTSTGEVESEFHAYVQPQEHPILSAFCTELTGITQTQVEAAIPLHICLSRFGRWLQELQVKTGLVFPNHPRTSAPSAASQKLCTFLTWSDWDLGVCLQYECRRKQIHKPDVLNSWIDLRSTYRLFYDRKPRGLNGALQDLGIQFAGREHSGLDDARNTAGLAARMMRDGCVMKVTRSLTRVSGRHPAPPAVKHNQSAVTNPPKEQEDEESTKTNSAQGVLPTCRSLVSPKTLLSGAAVVTVGPSTLKSSREAPRLLPAEEPAQVFHVETEERCGSCDHVVLEGNGEVHMCTSVEEVWQHSELMKPHTQASKLNRLQTGLSGATNVQEKSKLLQRNSKTTTRASCAWPEAGLCPLDQNPKSSFGVYKDPVRPSAGSFWATKRVLTSLSANVLNARRECSLKGVQRVTSPLCSCGRRAKRQVVSNGGPNHGRGFYCCAVRRSGGAGTVQKGCQFFQWESAVMKSS
uniref:ERI1 exoribonuclease 2 n=2 Tax=Tetraodon nigroviridis TaxID=99883 RepID=H3CS46_TETNG